ncbi:MAG: SpaA isopeptide-forming pilin-related protein [bacterium]|nr:SpaA isopeptide-forming pilin-related protein [bacterium]
MKKILLLLWISIIITVPSIVKAESSKFYESGYIPGAYIKKIKNSTNTGKYQQMRIFRRVNDNSLAYCLELWEGLNTSEVMSSIHVMNYANISLEKRQRVELLAYYGYGYSNHTSMDWYAITQVLIWQTISEDSTVYFTDHLNGKPTNKYNSKINELEELVKNHNVLPSFHKLTYTLLLYQDHIIEDTNHVLTQYHIVPNPNLQASKSNDILQIKGLKEGNNQLILKKGSSEKPTLVYASPNSQDVLVRGNYSPLEAYLNINTTTGVIEIQKVDSETKMNIPQGEAKLIGTQYGLYNTNNQLLETVSINERGQASFTNLAFGSYIIKEITAAKGYQLDQNSYQIAITNNQYHHHLTLENQVIKQELELQKYYKNGNSEKIYPEADAVFEIYNNQNKKIAEIKTNEDGKVKIILPYGTYRIKQKTGKKYYELAQDQTIKITGETKSSQTMKIINHEITKQVKIMKIDADTKLPIRFSKAQFKIKDLQTNQYLKYKDEEIYETNQMGILELPFKLKIGKHYLEEVESPVGYEKMRQSYLFEVPNNDQQKIELKIENHKKYGSIEIIKNGEQLNIEQDQFTYQHVPLSQVEFSLYASEDIITGDGKVHFFKDQLIKQKQTNSEGKIVFDSLLYGKYYILETKNLALYNSDHQKYYIEINDNHQTNTIEKINTLKKGTIRIKKLDNENLTPITNTEFTLYNKENKMIYKVKTNPEGNAYIFNLPLGKYYLKETKAPFPYLLKEEIREIQLVSNNQVIDTIFKNDKKRIEIAIPHTSINMISSIPPYYGVLANVLSYILDLKI